MATSHRSRLAFFVEFAGYKTTLGLQRQKAGRMGRKSHRGRSKSNSRYTCNACRIASLPTIGTSVTSILPKISKARRGGRNRVDEIRRLTNTFQQLQKPFIDILRVFCDINLNIETRHDHCDY